MLEPYHNAPITRSYRPRILFPADDFSQWIDKHLKGRDGKVADIDVCLHMFLTVDAEWPIREFNDEYFYARKNELDKHTSKSDRNRLQALRLLRHAFFGDDIDENKTLELLDKAGKMLAEDTKLKWQERIRDQGRDAARGLYPIYFSKAIKNARLLMWCRSGEWMPVVWCPDMTTAMFVYAAFNGVETCLNCQKVFCRDSPRVDGSRSEKYCTIACGQRFRQRLYRTKKNPKVNKKSKTGKQKSR